MPSPPAISNCSNNENGRQPEVSISCEPIRNYLELQSLSKKQQEFRRFDMEDPLSTEGSKYDTDHISVEIRKPEDTQSFDAVANRFENQTEEDDVDNSPLDTYSVPLSLIERWGSAMGILIAFCYLCLNMAVCCVCYFSSSVHVQ